MNYSYGEGNKIYGKNINEARYNALLETFYKVYPKLQKKIKLGKNYFDSDPKTAQFLEKRVLGEDIYIPDEDEDILKMLTSAYDSTKVDLEICSNKKDEKSCKNLKFKGLSRCGYEKKWFSYFRGGNCFISEEIIQHLLGNLQPLVDIDWESLKVKSLRKTNNKLPNPDELTKTDMINILHDLSYHIKSFYNEDFISVLEKKHGKELINLSSQEILYYVYLFSFIVYTAKFLNLNNYKNFFQKENFTELLNTIKNPPSKNNLINFIVSFFSIVSDKKQHKPKDWGLNVLIGPVLILLLLGYLPTAQAALDYTKAPEDWNEFFSHILNPFREMKKDDYYPNLILEYLGL